ncbi:hypothetical protein Dimus_031858 [Dionaea muscipula]
MKKMGIDVIPINSRSEDVELAQDPIGLVTRACTKASHDALLGLVAGVLARWRPDNEGGRMF